MLFWMTFITGLISLIVGFARDFKGIKKDKTSVFLFIVGLVGLVTSIPIYVSDKNEKNELVKKVESSVPVVLREQIDYMDISKLNARGSPVDNDSNSSIIFNTPLSTLLSKFISHDDKDNLIWSCDEDAINTYKKVNVEMPKFPFTFFYLGDCEKRMNSQNWHDEISKALKIIKITTTIDGHHRNHDELLKLINEKYGI